MSYHKTVNECLARIREINTEEGVSPKAWLWWVRYLLVCIEQERVDKKYGKGVITVMGVRIDRDEDEPRFGHIGKAHVVANHNLTYCLGRGCDKKSCTRELVENPEKCPKWRNAKFVARESDK